MIAKNPRYVRGAGLNGRSDAELAEAAANYRVARLGRLRGMVLPVLEPRTFTLDDLTPRAMGRHLARGTLLRSLSR